MCASQRIVLVKLQFPRHASLHAPHSLGLCALVCDVVVVSQLGQQAQVSKRIGCDSGGPTRHGIFLPSVCDTSLVVLWILDQLSRRELSQKPKENGASAPQS